MSLFSSFLPVAMLGLALGMVQPATGASRAPRAAGAGVERPVSAGGLRLRAGVGSGAFAALGELPLDWRLANESAPESAPSPAAIRPAGWTGLERPLPLVLTTATVAEPLRGRRPSGARLGRAPPVA